MLLTTPLSNREIILGKFASRLVVLLLLILSGMPALSLILLWGGVQPISILFLEAMTLFIAFCAGSYCLYASTRKAVFGTPAWDVYAGMYLIFGFITFLAAAAASSGEMNGVIIYVFCLPFCCAVAALTISVSEIRLASGDVRRIRPEQQKGQKPSASYQPRPKPRAEERTFDQQLGPAVAVVAAMTLGLLVLGQTILDLPLHAPFWLGFLNFGCIAGWIVIAIHAATNRFIDQSTGSWLLLLATPLEPNRLIAIATQKQRALLRRMLGYMGLYCAFGIILQGLDAIAGFVTFSLFGTVVSSIGRVAALTTPNRMESLALTILTVLLISVGWPTFVFVTDGSALFVSVISYGVLVITWLLSISSMTKPRIGAHLAAVYFAIVSICILLPTRSLRPFTENIANLAGSFCPIWWLAMPTLPGRVSDASPLLLPCYWLALILFIVWLRFWTIRNFDRLVGRPYNQSTRNARPTSG